MVKGEFSWLDLGSGDGELVQALREQGVEAVGVDKKQGQVIEKFEVTNLEKYEVISLIHVLEHLDKPVAVLKRVREWLKDDGVLVIEVPLVDNLTERWLKKDYLAYKDKTHQHFITQPQLGQWFEQAQLKVVGQGRTWHQLPFQVVRASFEAGHGKGLIGLGMWLPLKLLSVIGFNHEMMRVYLRKV